MPSVHALMCMCVRAHVCVHDVCMPACVCMHVRVHACMCQGASIYSHYHFGGKFEGDCPVGRRHSDAKSGLRSEAETERCGQGGGVEEPTWERTPRKHPFSDGEMHVLRALLKMAHWGP